MFRAFKIGIILGTLISNSPLYAVEIVCGGYDTTEVSKAMPSDTVRMLVIAMTLHEDSAYWESLGVQWPRMPDWLIDSFLMPHPWNPSLIDSYPKSFTHYLYHESQGNHIVVGEVNPGYVDTAGYPLFFVPDSLLSNYPSHLFLGISGVLLFSLTRFAIMQSKKVCKYVSD